MKLIKSTLILYSFLLVSCSNRPMESMADLFRPTTAGQAVRVVNDSPNPYLATSVTAQKKASMPTKTIAKVTTQRINTTQCHDNDDWYLDGYRVGKSFRAQKAEMLQNRLNYCQFSSLPRQFKQSWERGFQVGVR